MVIKILKTDKINFPFLSKFRAGSSLFYSKPYAQLLLIFMILFSHSTFAFAQTISSESSNCNCRDTFDSFVGFLEENYLGYHIAVRGKREAEYSRFINNLKKRAERTRSGDCVPLLHDLMRFFRDGHLFITGSPELSEEEINNVTASAEKMNVRESDIRRYLAKNSSRLDPVEGIWYSKQGHKFAVIRDPMKKKGRDFVAVMLSENVERWQSGHVKAEFRKLADGSYDVVYYNGFHYPLRPAVYRRESRGGAIIRRDGLLLHMPPYTWGKSFPLKFEEKELIDANDPRRPTIRLYDKSTVVVSVPSHAPEYAPALESLVEKFRDQILNAETLIIDVRGNEGGSSWMTRSLMPFLVTAKKKPSRFNSGNPVVLSSKENVEYFEQIQSQGWLPKKLLERMKSNPGKIIPFEDPDSPPNAAQTQAADAAATTLPRRVAILIDDGVVSAGEAFVLNAMRNEKVTLFGANTGGSIDYQSVTISRALSCKSLGLRIGLPTIASSDKLPNGGINASGIAPDVRIPRNIKNPIRFVADFYERRYRNQTSNTRR